MTRLAGVFRDHPSFWVLPLFLAVSLVPAADFALSRIFYMDVGGFSGSGETVLEMVRRWLPDVVLASFAGCFLAWIAGLLSPRWPWAVDTLSMAYLALTLLLGPGLMVETLLKPHWGRPRPKDIADFGGAAVYTPPWQMSDACTHNCSFVSGHAAIAFWVTAYAFLLPARWRRVGLGAGVIFGLAVGLVRIVQGAHFLSDVLMAGFIVLLINDLVAGILLKKRAGRS